MSGPSAPSFRLAALAALLFHFVRAPYRRREVSGPGILAGALGGLPPRDLWLLPLISFATMFVLVAVFEVGARIRWPEQQRDFCETATGHRPNCTSRAKIAEGPWVTYRYNECGWRAASSCAPRPADALRVAVVGTSISFGAWVPLRQIFSGRLEHALRPCGKPLDFQIDTVVGAGGDGGAKWSRTEDLVPRVLQSKPQVLLTVMAPFDLEEYVPQTQMAQPAMRASFFRPENLKSMLKSFLEDSRAAHMAQHFFYLDLGRYIPLYLQHGDAADFLRPPFTPAWRARLVFADRLLGGIADKAHKAGIPFIIAFMPNRVEAALSAAPRRGTHAFALPNALAAIAHRHGAVFADVTQLTRRMKRQDGLFYPVDGHPTAAGHALIARALRPVLESVPAFASCRGGYNAGKANPEVPQ